MSLGQQPTGTRELASTGPPETPHPDGNDRPTGHGRGCMRRALTRLDIKASPYLLIAPFFVLFGVFGLFPLIYTVWVSLHEWNLISAGEHAFIGLANYQQLFTDPYFWNALENTFGIFVLAAVPQLLLALLLAEILNRPVRARTFFRMGVLLPYIASTAAVAIVFKQLFGQEYGLINYLIGLVGVDPIAWQSDRLASWIAIAVMVDWRWTGYMTLIYLAAMQAIPRTLYEAAEIDGAGPWRRFRTITIPMLRPTLIFTVILATVGNMQLVAEPMLFDPNPATATGGAGRQFQTLQLFLYEVGFKNFDFGYAAAIGWVLFLIVILVAVINYLFTRRVRATH